MSRGRRSSPPALGRRARPRRSRGSRRCRRAPASGCPSARRPGCGARRRPPRAPSGPRRGRRAAHPQHAAAERTSSWSSASTTVVIRRPRPSRGGHDRGRTLVDQGRCTASTWPLDAPVDAATERAAARRMPVTPSPLERRRRAARPGRRAGSQSLVTSMSRASAWHRQGEVRPGRGGVPGSVGQGLLHDAEGRDVDGGRQGGERRGIWRHGQVDPQPVGRAAVDELVEPGEGGGRAAGPISSSSSRSTWSIWPVSVRAARPAARERHRAPASAADGVGAHEVARGGGLHDHRAQRVGEHVVQLAGDAQALAAGGLALDPLLLAHQLGALLGDPAHHLAAARTAARTGPRGRARRRARGDRSSATR